MTDKQLKKMSRRQLLEMLIELTEENERLSKQLKEAQAKLADKEIAIASAGTMAEAALKLNHVFQAADAAVQQYLHNIRGMGKEEHEEREATNSSGPAQRGAAGEGVKP